MWIGSSNLFFGMATSLAVLGIVGALTIDNQLTVIKNDCYERLAIGHRLNPKNVYKSFDYNTVTRCQMACTEEKNSCKAFSFGIGTKGNATCELSVDSIKETADLKPIGTITDTDYDLYIKKMGCSVVIDKNPHNKPPPDSSGTALKPGTLGLYGSESKPILDSKPDYGDSRPEPAENGYKKPSYSSDYNNNHYLPPNRDGVQHVQTMVSVASGPTSFLHPVHEILIGEGPYGYGRPSGDKYHKPAEGCCEEIPVRGCCDKGDRPPFRPPILNHPYDDDRPIHRPRPDDYDRPQTDYDARPGHFRPSSSYEDDRPPRKPYGPIMKPNNDRYDDPKPILGYGDEQPSRKPYGPVMRPDVDRYDDVKPSRPLPDRYDDRPPRRPFRPEPHDYDFRPNSDRYDRPLPHRYGSVIPHPDDYNNRPDSYDYFIPEPNRYDKRPPKRPYYEPSQPQDEYPSYNYDKPQRPFPGPQVYDNTKPTTPQPYLDSSTSAQDGYNNDKPVKGKPNRPLDPNNPNGGYAYDKPEGGNQLSYDGDKGSGSKPIVSQSVGYHGKQITSIITEIKERKYLSF